MSMQKKTINILPMSAVIQSTYGNQSKAARKLGINRATFAKHLPTDGVIVLEDGRVFSDTGKIYDENA